MSKTVLVTVAALSLLLLVAFGLVVYGQTRPLESTFNGALADLLPPAPPGWTRTARAIADTPEMRQKVDELLNYDDGVFYDYTKGNLRLSVYIAYWAPGKMSSRLVAGHTPDVCWVGAGWECTERRAVDGLSINGRRLPEVETRAFVADGTTEYVWFWHLVDGVPQSYGTGKEPPWYAGLRDILAKGMNQRGEQFFIRLSSFQKLSDPNLAPVLSPVLKSLPLDASSLRLAN